jgi:ribosomal protein L32
MGLFDKKYCDICGEKIGLLGNRKLENGNLCKNCAKKLSPWFSDRRSSTVDEIKAQLAYREENKEKVAAFHTTGTFGTHVKVLLDEDAGRFMVTSARDLEEANPDVLEFADVTGCNLDIDESRSELKREDKDGKRVSYNPPRYEYSYDFYITIFVNNPYFDEIKFKVNSDSVDIAPPPARPGRPEGCNPETNVEYKNYKKLGEEIKQALTKIRKDTREKAERESAPKTAVTCPHCGAATMPDANGCCEYCGSAVNG